MNYYNRLNSAPGMSELRDACVTPFYRDGAIISSSGDNRVLPHAHIVGEFFLFISFGSNTPELASAWVVAGVADPGIEQGKPKAPGSVTRLQPDSSNVSGLAPEDLPSR